MPTSSRQSFLTTALCKRAITSMGLVLFVSFLSYTAFVIATTISITTNQHTERQTVVLQSEIADLEVAFLQKSQTLTLEYAESQGFEIAEDITFARRTDTNNLALQ